MGTAISVISAISVPGCFYRHVITVVPCFKDYQAECHTPEYHIGIDLIKPCQNPVRMRYSGVWHTAGNRLNTT